MTSDLSHKKLQHLIEGEAYHCIMAGEAPATLNEFVVQLLDWVKETFPATSVITLTTIENEIRETWQRRHEMIRGGDC